MHYFLFLTTNASSFIVLYEVLKFRSNPIREKAQQNLSVMWFPKYLKLIGMNVHNLLLNAQFYARYNAYLDTTTIKENDFHYWLHIVSKSF